MPYTAVKERRKTMLTRGMTAMILLLATTVAPSCQLDYSSFGKRSKHRYFEETREWEAAEDAYEEELVTYALVHGSLKRKRSERHHFQFARKVVRASNYAPGNFRPLSPKLWVRMLNSCLMLMIVTFGSRSRTGLTMTVLLSLIQ